MTAKWPFEGTTATLTLRGRESKLRIQINPARITDPDGVDLCPVEAVSDVVYALLCAFSDIAPARFLVRPSGAGEIEFRTGWMQEVELKRIDVAVNVVHPAHRQVITSSAHTRPKHARTVHSYVDKQGICYVSATSGGCRVKLYDKTAESKGKAKPGTLRFEVEGKGKPLGRYGLRTLFDLTPANAHRLLTDQWGNSRWNLDLPMSDGLQRLLASDLSPSRKATLSGFLHCLAAGFKIPISPTTERQLLKDARTLGLQPGGPL